MERIADPGVVYRERHTYDQQGFLLQLDQESLETNGSAATLSWIYTPDSMQRVASVRAPERKKVPGHVAS